MTSDSVKLPPEARQRVEAYLDAIERVLIGAGMPRGERRGITDEVETQIGEMLAARAGAEPTVADVEAVLASLDPPEAYAPDAGAAAGAGQPGAAVPGAALAAARRPHFSRAAIAGACCAALTCVILVPLVAVVVPVLAYRMAFVEAPRLPGEGFVVPYEPPAVPASPGEESAAPLPRGRGSYDVGLSWAAMIVAIPLGLALLAGPASTTILGVVAIGHIRRSAGMIYGMGLALFDALVFPLLALGCLVVALGIALHMKFLTALVIALAVVAGLTVLACARLGGRAPVSRRVLGILSVLLAAAGLFVGAATVLLLRQADFALPYAVFLVCEAAALLCGLVAWRAVLPAKVGTVASAALMAVSLLFLV